jgi:hypothetical protein
MKYSNQIMNEKKENTLRTIEDRIRDIITQYRKLQNRKQKVEEDIRKLDEKIKAADILVSYPPDIRMGCGCGACLFNRLVQLSEHEENILKDTDEETKP